MTKNFQPGNLPKIGAGHRKRTKTFAAASIKKAVALVMVGAIVLVNVPRVNAQTLVLEGGAVVWIVGTVIAGGITYYVVQDARGNRWRVPIPNSGFPARQPTPRPAPRGEVYTQNQNSGVRLNPGEVLTLSETANGCKDKENRIKKAHPEWQFWLTRTERNPNAPQTNYHRLCIWAGPDARLIDRYYR